MSLFSFFKKPKIEFQHKPKEHQEEIHQNSITYQLNDLDFVDTTKSIFATVPVQLAKSVDVYSKKILEKRNQKFTFPVCPGIWDYSTMGYIIPAWTDIRIKANKAGSVVMIGGNNKPTPFANPHAMDTNILDGIFSFNDVPANAWNLPSPWKIFTNKKNISAFVLPAVYHTRPEILENLYIVPGVVDYDDFHIVNFIFSIRKKCQFTIKAGEPLLHFIPFLNSDIVCGYGPSNVEQEAIASYEPVIHESHFYRKKQQIKKTFELVDKVKDK